MSTDGAESPSMGISLNLNLRMYLIESRTFIRHVRHENKIKLKREVETTPKVHVQRTSDHDQRSLIRALEIEKRSQGRSKTRELL